MQRTILFPLVSSWLARCNHSHCLPLPCLSWPYVTQACVCSRTERTKRSADKPTYFAGAIMSSKGWLRPVLVTSGNPKASLMHVHKEWVILQASSRFLQAVPNLSRALSNLHLAHLLAMDDELDDWLTVAAEHVKLKAAHRPRESVYCFDCRMWCNSMTQFLDHQESKKHRKWRMHNTSAGGGV